MHVLSYHKGFSKPVDHDQSYLHCHQVSNSHDRDIAAAKSQVNLLDNPIMNIEL